MLNRGVRARMCVVYPGRHTCALCELSAAIPGSARRLSSGTAVVSDYIAASSLVTMSANGTGTFVFPWLVPSTFLPSTYGASSSWWSHFVLMFLSL